MSAVLVPLHAIPATRPQHDLACSDHLDEVERVMRSLAAGDRMERAGIMVQEHLASGGKRLRARLALAATAALGSPRADAVGWAAAMELLHNATLIHDDIQDGDRVRRGQPATWVRHGKAQAINAGDLLLMLPFLALSRADAPEAVRWQLSRALASHAAQIVRGQVEELDLLSARRFDLPSWRRAATGKTGGLFALPVEGAALLAGHGPERAAALGAALLPLGLLFQIQDDVLDLFGDKGREQVGNDLREGKVSALVVAHLARVPAHQDWLVQLLEAPRQETPDEDVARVISTFRHGGALDDTLDWIAQLDRQIATDPVLADEPLLHHVCIGLATAALAPIRPLLR